MIKTLMILFVILLSTQLLWASEDQLDTQIISFRHQPCMIIGFVANFPEQPLGLYLARTKPEGVGVYLSMKSSIFLPEDQIYDFSRHKAENIWEDQFLGEKLWYGSLSVGMIQTISKTIAFYLGAGIGFRQIYREYYDAFEIFGKHGQYYIEDRSETYANLNVGSVLMVSKKVNMNIGFDLEPMGINLGIGLTM